MAVLSSVGWKGPSGTILGSSSLQVHSLWGQYLHFYLRVETMECVRGRTGCVVGPYAWSSEDQSGAR
jgi:hypothetical protein